MKFLNVGLTEINCLFLLCIYDSRCTLIFDCLKIIHELVCCRGGEKTATLTHFISYA